MKRRTSRKPARRDKWIARIDQAVRQRRQRQLRVAWSEPNARDQMLLLNGFGQVVGEVGLNYYGTWRGWVMRDGAMSFLGEYLEAGEARTAVEQAYRDAIKAVGRAGK